MNLHNRTQYPYLSSPFLWAQYSFYSKALRQWRIHLGRSRGSTPRRGIKAFTPGGQGLYPSNCEEYIPLPEVRERKVTGYSREVATGSTASRVNCPSRITGESNSPRISRICPSTFPRYSSPADIRTRTKGSSNWEPQSVKARRAAMGVATKKSRGWVCT